ncbi:MAG: TolC family protein [Deltaproteobacteria bacterium]|jgi:outer membrane protein
MSAAILCVALLSAAQQPSSSEVMSVLEPTSGGLTTDEVIRRVLETSPEAMKAEVEHMKAAEEANTAWTGYAPRVDLSAGYQRLSPITLPPCDPSLPEDEQFFCLPPGVNQNDVQGFGAFPLDSYSLVASVSVPASDYFLRIMPGYDAVVGTEEVARNQLAAKREEVAFTAVQMYLDAIRARAGRVVAEKSVGVLTTQMEDLQKLAEAGLSTNGDVLQVKAQVASAQVALEQAKGGVIVANARLRRALHDPQAKLEHGEDLLASANIELPEYEAALEQAIEDRFELRALRKLVDVQANFAKLERVGVFPRLTIDGSATHARPNQRVFFDPTGFNTTWQIGVNLRWSPNDAVVGMSNWDNADRDVALVETDIIALTDLIAVEVANALATMRSTRASILAAREGLEAAEGAFDDRKKLLDAGQGTTRELLLAEQDLRNAELQIINAHLDLRLARARLDRALGRLHKGDDR